MLTAVLQPQPVAATDHIKQQQLGPCLPWHRHIAQALVWCHLSTAGTDSDSARHFQSLPHLCNKWQHPYAGVFAAAAQTMSALPYSLTPDANCLVKLVSVKGLPHAHVFAAAAQTESALPWSLTPDANCLVEYVSVN